MKRWVADRAFRLAQMLLRVLFCALYRVDVQGREHIPKRGGLLVVCNHQSHFDPPLVGCWYPRVSWFVARDSLFKGPFAAVIRYFKAVPIRRGEPDAATMKLFIEALRKGDAVTVFPEGTRSADGEVGTFLRGIALLVRRGQAAVLPAAIDGAHEIWPRSRSKPRLSGNVRIVFGEPIGSDALLSMDKNELLPTLERRVKELHAQIRQRVEPTTD